MVVNMVCIRIVCTEAENANQSDDNSSAHNSWAEPTEPTLRDFRLVLY